MEGWQASEQGTPQGSPISPLVANIMLDDLDAELERRGHRFVRYADDLRVYVISERAGQRVMHGITTFIDLRLKLRVNRRKSAIAPATTRPFWASGSIAAAAASRSASARRLASEPRTDSGN